MEKKIEEQLRYLSLTYLREHWDEILKEAQEQDLTIRKVLTQTVKNEYEFKKERARHARVKASRVPTEYRIETYPFSKQPHLNKKRLMENFDSLNYITDNRNILLLGPTGAGKTGLGTAFLLNAIDAGYRCRFVLFSDLISELWGSQADNTSRSVINKYSSYDCLLIDELGYLSVEKSQVGLFFNLMQKRYKKTCTIITSNMGLTDWGEYFGDKHLAAALIDRLTDNGHVINMNKCQSIRSDADVD